MLSLKRTQKCPSWALPQLFHTINILPQTRSFQSASTHVCFMPIHHFKKKFGLKDPPYACSQSLISSVKFSTCVLFSCPVDPKSREIIQNACRAVGSTSDTSFDIRFNPDIFSPGECVLPAGKGEADAIPARSPISQRVS